MEEDAPHDDEYIEIHGGDAKVLTDGPGRALSNQKHPLQC